MEPRPLERGEIVQLDPDTAQNKAFGGTLMYVDEPKSWGAQLGMFIPKDRGNPPVSTFYRATYEQMLETGGRMALEPVDE